MICFWQKKKNDREKQPFWFFNTFFINPPIHRWRKYKIVYRRYAGLYFSFCVDVNDNDLAYLENIHLLVEVLDHYFGNVCELDLVFNFHKVWNSVILFGENDVSSRHLERYNSEGGQKVAKVQ